jgi:hypothetical protein
MSLKCRIQLTTSVFGGELLSIHHVIIMYPVVEGSYITFVFGDVTNGVVRIGLEQADLEIIKSD